MATTVDVSPERIAALVELLSSTWPDAVVELDFEDGYQLLVATILSAQSTDELVNKVTPALFEKYPTPADLAGAEPAEVEALVHSTGFYRQKTRNIMAMAQKLVADFGGEVPQTLDEMTTLPGVARKTANVVLGQAYRINSGFTVDTHVKRLAGRLGLSANTDPVKIERDLMEVLPESTRIDLSQQIIWHGRRVCDAKKPRCNECVLAPHCPSFPIEPPPKKGKKEANQKAASRGAT
jgi:endonuclease-3